MAVFDAQVYVLCEIHAVVTFGNDTTLHILCQYLLGCRSLDLRNLEIVKNKLVINMQVIGINTGIIFVFHFDIP